MSASTENVRVLRAAADLHSVRVLLCDADDNLFPSERPAYEASVDVVNGFLEALGAQERFGVAELQRSHTGKNFRTVALELVREHEVQLPPAELDAWAAKEKRAVTDHLRHVLKPDQEVLDVLTRLSADYALAAVSSSALSRIDACLSVTGLAELLPPEVRFSAEDSLPHPSSKPDPAIYRLAVEELGFADREALAIEDSPTGVAAAVGARLSVIGNVRFVPVGERPGRTRDLLDAGAMAVVSSWREIEVLLVGARG